MVALFGGGVLAPSNVQANTESLSDGSGYGQAYRNNYTSGCWDDFGGTQNCYQGTWGQTTRNLCVCNDLMLVTEKGDWYKPDLDFDPYGSYHWQTKNAVPYMSQLSAYTNGANYDALHDHRISSVNKTYHENMVTAGYAMTYDQ